MLIENSNGDEYIYFLISQLRDTQLVIKSVRSLFRIIRRSGNCYRCHLCLDSRICSHHNPGLSSGQSVRTYDSFLLPAQIHTRCMYLNASYQCQRISDILENYSSSFCTSINYANLKNRRNN